MINLKNLLPKNILQELEFRNQDSFDAYKKNHKMRPDTKVTIAGKKTTVADAEKKSGIFQKLKSNIFGNDEPPTTMPKIEPDNPINRMYIFDPKSGRKITVNHITKNPEKFGHLAADVQSIIDTDPEGKKASKVVARQDAKRKEKEEIRKKRSAEWKKQLAAAEKSPKKVSKDKDDDDDDDFTFGNTNLNTFGGSTGFGGSGISFGGGGSSGGGGATGGW